jgi:hypothetical protein
MSIYFLWRKGMMPNDARELIESIQQMDLTDPSEALAVLMTLATTLDLGDNLSDADHDQLVVMTRQIVRTLGSCPSILNAMSPDFVFWMENVVGEGAGSIDWSSPDLSMSHKFQLR